MLPLNYAILLYFTKVEAANVEMVMQALQGEYSAFKAFKKNEIFTALLIAKANAILEESTFELDENNCLQLYFKITDDGRAMVEKYIVS